MWQLTIAERLLHMVFCICSGIRDGAGWGWLCWPGLSGTGWGWRGLSGPAGAGWAGCAGQGWLGLAGSGQGWLGLAGLAGASLGLVAVGAWAGLAGWWAFAGPCWGWVGPGLGTWSQNTIPLSGNYPETIRKRLGWLGLAGLAGAGWGWLDWLEIRPLIEIYIPFTYKTMFFNEFNSVGWRHASTQHL